MSTFLCYGSSIVPFFHALADRNHCFHWRFEISTNVDVYHGHIPTHISEWQGIYETMDTSRQIPGWFSIAWQSTESDFFKLLTDGLHNTDSVHRTRFTLVLPVTSKIVKFVSKVCSRPLFISKSVKTSPRTDLGFSFEPELPVYRSSFYRMREWKSSFSCWSLYKIYFIQ